MIRARLYRDGIDVVEVADVGDLPAPDDGALLWVDCDEPTNDELEVLGTHFALNEFVIEDLEHGGQRAKLDHYEDHFHVAVHDCTLLGKPDRTDAGIELSTREIDVVFGDGWLISVCQPAEHEDHPRSPMAAVRQAFERQRSTAGTNNEGFLLWALLDVVVDHYFLVSDAFDERLDELQEVVLDEDVDRIRRGGPRELFDMSKALLRFRRAALPLREVIGQVTRGEAPHISTDALSHFQDLYDHVLRVADLTESQRDVLTGLRDADLAVTSNQMSLVQQKIAAWGAILLIATLVTGFLGMNFRDAPDVSWVVGFLLVAAFVAILGWPMYRYFRRRKWL